MFEIGFLCPKSGKEMEKIDFGADRNRLQVKHFLKLDCLLLLFFSILVVANADNVDC